MTRLPLLLLFAGTSLTASAQSLSIAAAPDAAYPFGLQHGMEIVYQLQDAKGKTTGFIRNRVVKLDSEQNEKKTITTGTALLKSGLYDAKNKLLNLQDLTFRSRQDTSFTDGASELKPEKLTSFRDRIFVYSPTPVAWPNQPTVGTSLPSGGISVQVSSSAVDIAKVYANVQKRQVVGGLAPITTPAGTFQCYKVEAELESATVARTDMVIRNRQRVVDYYSPAVGLVKTEIYDKKGKLEQVRLLMARNPASAQTAMPEKYKAKTKVK